MNYIANNHRYDAMLYNRCGKSGLNLPAMSLGLWHNFGSQSDYSNAKEMILGAFDLGITHFDLANNYGPPAGSAEETFGQIISQELKPYRDEIVVSSKAGYYMWPGPYGEWGSRKQLIASLDQSLKRMKLDYVDIFYHHRPDPNTPLEETMGALADIVKSGKALYVGISNYNPTDTLKAANMLSDMGVHLLIHQMRLSMLDRENEAVLPVLKEKGIGGIAFSPLAQGILTGKYLDGIPSDSRAAGHSVFLNEKSLTPEIQEMTKKLNELAKQRGQKLSQLALAWILSHEEMTSVILGARTLHQIQDNVETLKNITLSKDELNQIHSILQTKEDS